MPRHNDPVPDRYTSIPYRRSGRSGLLLPTVSLGLWHNFGESDDRVAAREMILTAFDKGITHFDIANNYGPPPGSAEITFGEILKTDLWAHRDEIIVSSKAGWRMWPGPYGDFGSRKYLVASCDQSLRRLGLDYVDIFYHHRPDPYTPLEETMGALDYIVRSGRALYVGISSYNAEETAAAAKLLRELGTPCLIHQPKYSMFDRWIEHSLLDTLEEHGLGCIIFSPLEQGILTNKYLTSIPPDSRAGRPDGFLTADQVTSAKIDKVKALTRIANAVNLSMAQLAVAWTLRDERVTSAIIGASRQSHIEEAVQAANAEPLSEDILREIEDVLAGN